MQYRTSKGTPKSRKIVPGPVFSATPNNLIFQIFFSDICCVPGRPDLPKCSKINVLSFRTNRSAPLFYKNKKVTENVLKVTPEGPPKSNRDQKKHALDGF